MSGGDACHESVAEAAEKDLVDGAFCVGFLSGYTGNSNGLQTGVCTDGAAVGIVVRAYIAYMERNPKLQEEDRREGLRLALQDAFACPASAEPRTIERSRQDRRTT